MTIAATPNPDRTAHRLTIALAIVLAALCVASLAMGAMRIAPTHVLAILASFVGVDLGVPVETAEQAVVRTIRLPRLAMGLAVGAGLASAGATLQGIFRNPLADPGLIGVSAGAAAGAATVLVLGDAWVARLGVPAPVVVAVAAAVGGWATTLVVYRLATRAGHTSAATMLLAGVAMNALGFAWIGWMTWIADDAQLRAMTMWSLGSLGATTPAFALWLVPPTVLVAVGMTRLGTDLDALSLGDAAARHLGRQPDRIRRRAIVGASVAAGLTVGVTGLIGFVGLVVPHIIRLVVGPSHGRVITLGLLLGPILVVGGDLVARTAAAPLEMPVGVVMSTVGAPVLLWLLLQSQRGLDV